MNYEEESGNEMIQLVDHAKLLAEDEGKYKRLHSHVKNYNKRNLENRIKLSNGFSYSSPYERERFNLEEEDIKYELDYATFSYTTLINVMNRSRSNKNKGNMQHFHTNDETQMLDKPRINFRKRKVGIRGKRVNKDVKKIRNGTMLESNANLVETIRNRKVTVDKAKTMKYFGKTQVTRTRYNMYNNNKETTSRNIKDILRELPNFERFTITNTEDLDEKSYDYQKFKMEYEQQLEYNIKHDKMLNNSEINETKDTPKKALMRIMYSKSPRNCTKEELKQIGITAIECLIYDYQRTKDIATARTILSRTWLVLRVWFLIYICLAIPSWCQRGWCCCCFCCKFCFPRERILLAKQYYITNPPGVLNSLKKNKEIEETVRFEANEYEYSAYETLGLAISNL